MIYSNSFVTSVTNIFSQSEGSDGSHYSLNSSLSLDKNNLFNRFLKVRISNNELDIPVFARSHIEGTLINQLKEHGSLGSHEFVIPLYQNGVLTRARTFDRMLSCFFIKTQYSYRISRVIMDNKDKYYGGRGLIFNSNFELLLLCAFRAKLFRKEDSTLEIGYCRPVIYVSPRVFENLSNSINKNIVNKLVSYYANIDLPFPNSDYNSHFLMKFPSNEINHKALVIIDNIDRFLVTPTIPKPQPDINESINEFLVNNISDIIS